MLSLSNPDPEFSPLLPFGIAVFRGTLNPTGCDEIRRQLEASDNWQDLQFGEYRNGVLNALNESADVRALVNYSYAFPAEWEAELKEAASEFAHQTWKIATPHRSRMTASCLRIGMTLGSHRDSNYSDTPRLATVVAYFSDGYQGGCLVFPELGIRFCPEKGDVLIFFSEHTHLVEEVQSGVRYTGVFFLETETKNP